MPQPLSRVIPKCKNLRFDADSLSQYPELAIQIAISIAKWSIVEHRIAWLLIKMLGADAKPAFAMFSQIVSTSLQLDVLNAAAESALPKADYKTFSIVIKIISSQAKQRNKLAHGLWGITPDVENALLLMDSDHVFQTEIEQAAYKKDPHGWFKETGFNERSLERMILFDHSQIHVYRKRDFENIARDFNEASHAIFLFGLMIDPDEKSRRDDIFQSLSSLRLFREVSAQKRAHRRKSR